MRRREERAPDKTLTFGLGEIQGYDPRRRQLITLDDEQRKQTDSEIQKGFRDFARLCNMTTAVNYVTRILEVDLKDFGLNKGYKPYIEKFKLETSLGGMVLNQAGALAGAHFAGEHGKSLMRRGESVLPTHKADGTHPIYLHKNAVRLHREDKHWYIVYNLFMARWAKEKGLSAWVAFRIHAKPRDRVLIGQLERVLSGEWASGAGRLRRNPRRQGPRYIGQLTVNYRPDPCKPLSPSIVMGIDLGVMVPAAVHIRENGNARPWAKLIGNGRQMLATRAVIRNEIVRLIRALRKKNSSLVGPAREHALNRLRELRKREKRVMKTASQRIAAEIAEIARREGAGRWQMEALGGDIKEESTWLRRNWGPRVGGGRCSMAEGAVRSST